MLNFNILFINTINKINSKFIYSLTSSSLNQIVSSGSNFALNLYLIRELTLEDFGLYGVCSAISFLFIGFGNALFITQMVVHLPDKESLYKKIYSANILILIIIFCSIFLLCNLLFILGAGSWISLNHKILIAATMVLSLSSLIKFFYIRLSYSIIQEYKALIINCTWTISLILIILLNQIMIKKLNIEIILFELAFSNFLSILVGLLIIKLPFNELKWWRIKNDLSEVLQGGRWALGGVTVTWIQNQAYMYVTTFLVGTTGVAIVNTARIVISPFTFFLPALTELLLPRLALLRNLNSKSAIRKGEIYTIIIAFCSIAYLFLIWILGPDLLSLMIGNKYPIELIWPMTLAWGFSLIFQLARDGASTLLQVLKNFKYLMLANFLTSIFVVIATIFLSIYYGISGAVMGLGIGDAILAFVLWRKLYKVKNA